MRFHLSKPLEEKLAAVGLLLLRVSVGATMALQHGLGKAMRFSTLSEKFPDPIGVGSTASLSLALLGELLCPIALVLGLLTRLATIPLLTTMLVAAFVIHGGDPFKKKELALLYAAGATTLLLTGAGAYSIDGWLARRRR